jgi:hypothetical protein
MKTRSGTEEDLGVLERNGRDGAASPETYHGYPLYIVIIVSACHDYKRNKERRRKIVEILSLFQRFFRRERKTIAV